MMDFLKDKQFLVFVTKFLLLFLLLYFGTIAIIGLAAPGDYYSPFIEKYLDYVSWIKVSLMKGTQFLLSLFNYKTRIEPNFIVRIVNARGVIIAMDCVGYGVYSFWIAFVIACSTTFLKKLTWIIFGVFLLWIINVIRISLFLVAINKGWAMPLGLDHHTWFNIFAYLCIFTMIYFFDRSLQSKKRLSINES